MSLIITVGAPGSGKSTWAEANLSERFLRLERDRFREAIFGNRRAYWDHPLPRESKSMLITDSMMAAMRAWPDICWAVTDTGLLYRSVEPFITFARTRGVQVEIVVFKRNLNYLNKINRTRPEEHRVDPALLKSAFEMLRDPAAWWKKPREGMTVWRAPAANEPPQFPLASLEKLS